MKIRYLRWIGVALVGASTLQAASPQASTPQAGSQYNAVVGRYCLTCHNEKLKTADVVPTPLSFISGSIPAS